MTEEIETNPKVPKFKVEYKVRISKYKNIFGKCYTVNCLKEICGIDSDMKTNPRMYKIKDPNGEKIVGSFCEKELLLSKL